MSAALPILQVEQHLTDHAFRAKPDNVQYLFPAVPTRCKKKPLSRYLLHRAGSPTSGSAVKQPPCDCRLKSTMASTRRQRFREKAHGGCHWIASPPYKKRLGDNSGLWLVTTTGGKRLQNMMEQVRNPKRSPGPISSPPLMSQDSTNLFIDPVWRYADKPNTLIPFPL